MPLRDRQTLGHFARTQEKRLLPSRLRWPYGVFRALSFPKHFVGNLSNDRLQSLANSHFEFSCHSTLLPGIAPKDLAQIEQHVDRCRTCARGAAGDSKGPGVQRSPGQESPSRTGSRLRLPSSTAMLAGMSDVTRVLDVQSISCRSSTTSCGSSKQFGLPRMNWD